MAPPHQYIMLGSLYFFHLQKLVKGSLTHRIPIQAVAQGRAVEPGEFFHSHFSDQY